MIQPLETSMVSAIHVENGQRVSQGDLLVELDATDVQANLEQVGHEMHSTGNEIKRRQVLLDALGKDELLDEDFDGLFDSADRRLQEQLLKSAYEEIAAGQAEIRHSIERAKGTMTGAQEQVYKLKSVLPIVTERVDALEQLASKNLVARTQYLELEQELMHR